jgi:competence protein ComEA
MQDTKNLHWIIVGVAGLALIVGLVLARHLAHAPTTAAAQPDAPATVPAQLLSTDVGASALSASPAPEPTRIEVYVCGDVRRPGVYALSSSQRVIDGIARAGGALPDADLEQLNLAQLLSDAMKIQVPKKGEHLASALADTAFGSTDFNPRRSAHRGGRSSHKLQPGQTLDVNTASETELTSLPGVGPSLARRIVEYRTANGPFQTVDDLQNVSGIGPAKFDRMAPFIRL